MKDFLYCLYGKREDYMRIHHSVGIFLLLTVVCFLPASTMAKSDSGYDSFRKFSQIMDIIEQSYVKPVEKQELINGAIEGMLNRLDPHSGLIEKKEYEFMQEEFSGEFGGIGVQIGIRDKRLTVIAPIEDTPADKAGLLAGDIIVKIDGQNALNMTLIEAISKIRGKKGEPVVLTVIHAKGDKPVDIKIVRGTIPIQSVKVTELEPGYLHVRITDFKGTTTDEMRDAINKYRKKHRILGIVLDLRNNPGGLLTQAVSVADMFLEEGLIVYTQGRDAKNKLESRASRQINDLDCPLVVLINSGSASASEIVAGAIQDRKRGILLGEKTFGKGSVQTVLPMKDGSAIKLTIALYYTPSGRSIQAEGISPDIYLPFELTQKDDKSFLGDFREEDLERHLDNPDGQLIEKKSVKSAKKNQGEGKELLKNDNQLRMGLQMVKSLPAIMNLKH